MNQDYLWTPDNIIAEMRLIAEGAIVLYEQDAMPLYQQATADREAKAAFNDIGKALYLLRDRVHALETAYDAERKRP